MSKDENSGAQTSFAELIHEEDEDP